MRLLFIALAAAPLAVMPFGNIEQVFKIFSDTPQPVVAPHQEIKRFTAEYDQFKILKAQFPAKDELDSIAREIQRQSEKARSSSPLERELTTRKIATLNQTYQLIVDTQALFNQMGMLYLEREQLAESEVDLSKLMHEPRTVYSFVDLDQVRRQIGDVHNRQEDFKRTEEKLKVDLGRFTQSIATTNKELNEKQQQQKAYIGQQTGSFQEAELIDYQMRAIGLRKEYAQWKIREIQLRQSIVALQLATLKPQLEVLQQEYTRIKQATVISHDDVKKAVMALEEKSNTNYYKRKKLREEKMPFILQARQETQRQLDALIAQYGISSQDITALRDGSFQPKTLLQWIMLSELYPVITRDSLIDTNKEYVQAESDFLRAELKRESIEVAIIKSWEKFFSRRFRSSSEKDIEESAKEFEGVRNELNAQLRQVTDARDSAISSLQRLNKSIENIKNFIQAIQAQQRGIFKDNGSKLQACVQWLKEAEENIRQKIDTTAQLIEKYQAMVSVLDDSMKRVSSMITELSGKGFWRRADSSIEWGQIKNTFHELRSFFYNIFITGREYVSVSYASQLFARAVQYAQQPLHLLMLIITLIMIGIFYVLLRLFLPDLFQYLSGSTYGTGFMPYLQLLAALGIKFIIVHMNSLYAWALLYGSVTTGVISDPFVAMVINLISIPYLMYLLASLIVFIQAENKYRNYSIISQSYQTRFLSVLSVVGHCLIVLYFLRGALLLDNSELSIILLAVMFIVLQIGLISLIGKKQILAITPSDTPLWQWAKDHIDRYYYFLWVAFIAVIVMSNPYVGYGRQVFYLTSRIFVTLLVIPVFLWLHSRLKRVSSSLFFYYEEGENLKERFSSGRIWYGAFIIATFVLFVMLMVFTIGIIWGYGISLGDMLEFLRKELTAIKNDAGKDIPVTILSLLQIIFFIIGGIAINYVINEFVIKRVFDPFLVGAGVQNTISALTKYGILIVAVFMGLTNAGLEGLTTKFAILLAGIGIAVQEPLRDFFSYFIILVQRPVKVGDLIQVNEDVMGIVRHITPRSVILRRRNSVTIVVPNSQIILNPITNWSYSRGFFAFNDIMLTVPFTSDPQKVKEIILETLHANYTILKSPAPIVWLDNFVDNGYQFLVRGFLTSDKVLEQWEISSQVRLEIVKRLREHGIVIASPTRMVKVVGQDSLPPQDFHR